MLKKWCNKKTILVLAMVVAVISTISIYAYNLPVNRLNRMLDLGNKYLSELDYSNAIAAYDKALEIDDRCIEAYRGGIEARLAIDDEDIVDFYNQAINILSISEQESTDEKLDDMIYISKCL